MAWGNLVFDMSLIDLQNNKVTFRKCKVISETVRANLTNFHCKDFTHDQMHPMAQIGRHNGSVCRCQGNQ